MHRWTSRALLLLWASCTSVEKPAASAPEPLHVGQGLTAEPPETLLQVGEACGQYEGNAACASRLCARVSPGVPPVGFCSIRCRAGDPDGCPDGWACSAVWPGPEGSLCTPSRGWTGGRATWKGGPVPVRVPPTAAFVHAPDAGAAP